MADFYRAKIVAKRQITLPQIMLTQLGLEIGDELEFTVANGVIDQVRPFRPMPLNPFTDRVQRTLARREEEIASGKYQDESELVPPEKKEAIQMIMAAPSETLNALVHLLKTSPRKVELTYPAALPEEAFAEEVSSAGEARRLAAANG